MSFQALDGFFLVFILFFFPHPGDEKEKTGLHFSMAGKVPAVILIVSTCALSHDKYHNGRSILLCFIPLSLPLTTLYPCSNDFFSPFKLGFMCMYDIS